MFKILKKITRIPIRIILIKIYKKIKKLCKDIVCYYKLNINYYDKKFSDFNKFQNKLTLEFIHEIIYKYESKNLDTNIINDADKICNHIFNCLSDREYYLGENINWCQDFKSGYVWPKKYYKLIRLINLEGNIEVKIPWEISRMHQLIILATAYDLTKNKKYVDEYVIQIESWIEQNPFLQTVNWCCTMDVAIRAVNIIYSLKILEKNSVLDKELLTRINKLLYLHGIHIQDNLEKYEEINFTNNHYMANVCGLIWLGLYFEGLQNYEYSKKWLKFGIKEFELEIMKQINFDGSNFESSTSYHRLVSEMILYTYYLIIQNNRSIVKECVVRINKMIDFICAIIKPNSLCPLIGDVDNGRFLIFLNYYKNESRDFREIFIVASKCINIIKYNDIAKGYLLEICEYIPFYKEKKFDDGGYFIISNESYFVIIRCGSLSCNGQGGHSHNDQLSFELNYKGEDYFVDPGNYSYTSDYKMRNEFRKTCNHNTLQVENYEQNNFYPNDLFAMKEESYAECSKFESGKFIGKHFGFLGKCGIIHRRDIKVNDRTIDLKDTLILQKFNNKLLEINTYFIIQSNIKIEVNNSSIKLLGKNGSLELIVNFSCEILIEDTYISSGYGKLQKAKKIHIISKMTDESEIEYNYMIRGN